MRLPLALAFVASLLATGAVEARDLQPISNPNKLPLALDTDYVGGDYLQGHPMSLSTCHAYCMADTKCLGFSYVEATKWCWLKSEINAPSVRGGVLSWTKE
jgi:hypothetical protein